jgi:murein L,D-transpeptidase YafK
MMMKRLLTITVLLALSWTACSAEKTIADRVAQFGAAADKRLMPYFASAGVSYPPSQVTLIGLKEERQVQLYAAGTNGQYHFIRSYPILAASGNSGPKLREGDAQVPEGFYCIESLNPNSRFHLSLRINYPNAFDRAQAKAEGRTNLGGDIMIHGNAVSIGCLAMGDIAAEDLFVLADRTRLRNIHVILSPVDFREGKTVELSKHAPLWLGRLYKSMKAELTRYGTGRISDSWTGFF